jgi:hypothetical protein
MNSILINVKKRARSVVVFGLATLALSVAAMQSSALPPTGPVGPSGPTGPTGPKPPPHKGNPTVPFNGSTAINVEDTGPTGKPIVKTVQTLNLKDDMNLVWNSMTPELTKQFSAFLSDKKNTAGHRLYNINIKLAKADARDKMFLQVDSEKKLFAITYIVPGNEVDFKADTGHWYEPDPSFSVKFDLVFTMHVDCKGAGNNGPLVLQSATLAFSNVKVDGNFIATVEDWLADLFGGKDPAAAIQKAFSMTHPNITSKLNGAIATINNVLKSFVKNPTVTPSYDAKASRFVLTLVGKPVIKPLGTQPLQRAEAIKPK